MNTKKLDVPKNCRNLLIDALKETADTLDQYMRRIYDRLADEVPTGDSHVDRLYLNSAEHQSVLFALRLYEKNHGPSPRLERMKMQLVMIRRDWNKLVCNHDAAAVEAGAANTIFYVASKDKDAATAVRTGLISSIWNDGDVSLSDMTTGESGIYPLQRIFLNREDALTYWEYLKKGA